MEPVTGTQRRSRGSGPGRDTLISRGLSGPLRHGHGGVVVPEDGFVVATEEDVRRIAAVDNKQRYTLRDGEAGLEIRANQGHSVEVKALDLTPLRDAAEFPTVVHGTTIQAWDKIRAEGLRRMTRQHIHFAPGLPGGSGVISGMRSRCAVYVYVDLRTALADGIPFYVSANQVILSPGIDGVLPRRYLRAVRSKDHRELE